MNHLIAILAFGVFCALWFVVQRWAGGEGEVACDRCEDPGCAMRPDRSDDERDEVEGAALEVAGRFDSDQPDPIRVNDVSN